MRIPFKISATIFALSLFASGVNAQESAAQQNVSANADVKKKAPAPVPIKKNDTDDIKVQPAKKMVQDATINLQTTITGNQEQPRVLYILPWQSPQTANVDFESFDNQQKVVFGHVEREELRRELESAGELQ